MVAATHYASRRIDADVTFTRWLGSHRLRCYCYSFSLYFCIFCRRASHPFFPRIRCSGIAHAFSRPGPVVRPHAQSEGGWLALYSLSYLRARLIAAHRRPSFLSCSPQFLTSRLDSPLDRPPITDHHGTIEAKPSNGSKNASA